MVQKAIYTTALLILFATSYGQEIKPFVNPSESENIKMKIEVWSDISCPFCYLGKTKFEKALAQFPDKSSIEVEWKSFQLNPQLVTNTGITVYDYLATEKRMSPSEVKQMTSYVTKAASQAGLEYNFDKVVVANTFKAHRMLHFAKEQGLQGKVKERLLKAYFTEGANVDDTETLIRLGLESGLDSEKLPAVLQSDAFADEVQADIDEAQQLEIHSVPFFVFNRNYAVNGAQDTEVFLQTLEKSFNEWRVSNPAVTP